MPSNTKRPEDEMHLFLMHQAARLCQRLIRIAGGVGDDDLDLAAASGVLGLLPVQVEAVLHFLARRG